MTFTFEGSPWGPKLIKGRRAAIGLVHVEPNVVVALLQSPSCPKLSLNCNEPLIYLKGKVSGRGTGTRHLQNDCRTSQRQPVGFIRAALRSYCSDQTAPRNQRTLIMPSR